jgi:hypothetical protein
MSFSACEFTGRDDLLFFKKFRVIIDVQRDRVVFENCVRPRVFFNLLPLKHVECRCSEIFKVLTHSHENLRMVTLTIAAGEVGFNDGQISDFDQFVSLVRSLENPSACPKDLETPKTDYVAHIIFGIIFLALAAVVAGVFLKWF